MKHRPVILITPSTADNGAEFSDASISLSNRYTDAIIAAGGLPQIFPATTSKEVIAEAVERCDGVLMTGGDDIDPKLYAKDLPEALAKTVGPLEPDRDTWEKTMITEIFQRQKPLFGICRGHQMLNVALGGTLIVDIPSQVPNALNHRRMDKKMEPVHEVTTTIDSMLRQITGEQTFGVNSTHHQAIGQLARPLRAVATSSDGIIEAVELKDPSASPFLLAVQFHPERLIDKNKVFLQLFSSFIEACAQPPHQANMQAKVMIVDDGEDERNLMAALLTANGYETVQKANGAELVASFAEGEPDALLLDLQMPDSNGLDLLPQIKRQWPDVEVIVLTGYATYDIAVEAVKRGAYHFQAKPFDAKRLLVSLERAIEHRRLKRQKNI